MEEKGHGKIASIEVKALNTIIKYEDGHEVSLQTFEVFGNNRKASEKCVDDRFKEYGKLTNYEAEIGSAYGSYSVATGNSNKTDYSPTDFVEYTGLNVNIVKLFANAGNIAACKEADKQVYDLLQAYKRINSSEPMKDGDQELISEILSFNLDGIGLIRLEQINEENGSEFSQRDFEEIKEEIVNSALCCDTSEIAQVINLEELNELVSLQDMSKIKRALEKFKNYLKGLKDKFFNKNQEEK